jgi:hypothetical protein
MASLPTGPTAAGPVRAATGRQRIIIAPQRGLNRAGVRGWSTFAILGAGRLLGREG